MTLATLSTLSFADVRRHLLARDEIALIDLREEDPFAQAHPLWAANMPVDLIERDAARRIPRRDTLIVLYGEQDGIDRVPAAAERFAALGYTNVHALEGGLDGWRAAGGELFRDVNVPSKSFGELVEHERHTPSLSAQEVKALIDAKADVVVLDARRFDEYRTMSIPGATSVPGAELVLRARTLAPDPKTQVIVNCAGRTRSIDPGASRRAPEAGTEQRAEAQAKALAVAERAGARRITLAALGTLELPARTVYRFDVRAPEEYAAGHLPGFASTPGGQLVQETDHVAPVRGARIVLADDDGVRAPITASWLAQMGWEVYVLEPAGPGAFTETGAPAIAHSVGTQRYRRPYEGTDASPEAMQAYLDWEFGLVDQLARDGTHHFKVL